MGAGAQHLLRYQLDVFLRAAQASGHHGNADIVAHGVVVGDTLRDRRVRCGKGAHGSHDFLDLFTLQATAGRDVDQHAARAGQVDAIEQRRSDSLFGGDARAVDAGSGRRAHHGLALLAHDGFHVVEVDVDVARHVDDLGNAGHRVVEHIIGVLHPFQHAFVFVDLFQFFIEDDDQRIDVQGQLLQAFVGDVHALLAFVREGLRYHGDRQRAQFLGHFGHDRSGARARAAAHAGSDENHVRAAQRIGDARARFFGQLAADGRLHAGAQTGIADLDDVVRLRCRQGLCVGVGGNELHTRHAFVDHVLDCIATRTADADDLDDGTYSCVIDHIELHDVLLSDAVSKRQASYW